MKVLYIHQFFNTPKQGGSLRSYYLAKELVAVGHQVIMVTTHNSSFRKKVNIDGIQVVYLPVIYDHKMSFPRRSVAFLQFVLLAIAESVQQKKIDVCYIMTTPLSTGIVALFNKFFLRRPYLFEVGDLWPKVPIEMGLLKSRWKQKLLYWSEKLFYKNAIGIVGLSQPISDYINAINTSTPVETIYNISDCEHINPCEKDADLVTKYEVANQLVLSYTGTFGIANDLFQILKWAENVADLPVKFLMVGYGAEQDKIRNYVREHKLTNVSILDAMSKIELKEIINISDGMIVSFAQYQTLHTGSPNKLFDALAAGKLVFTNFDGWVANLITKNQCGFYSDSNESFRREVLNIIQNPDILGTYQSNARILAEQKFDLKIQAKKHQDFIEKCLSQ